MTTAIITTRYGSESHPTSVDAEITVDGVCFDVTLYRDAGTGLLSVDEVTATEFWCSGAYAEVLDGMDEDERDETIVGIESAVRAAA